MKFSTGQIISAGTGRLCCPSEELYQVLNFLTGDNLFTYQLPRAFHACKNHVINQHPWLLELDVNSCNKDTWRKWLSDAETRFGSEHELEALPDGKWMSVDPVREAIELMEDKKRVVVVVAT